MAPCDAGFHVHLMLKMERDALVALNWAIFCGALVSTIFGIISVTADPASRMHLDFGLLWVGIRMLYVVAVTALSAALSFRDGSRAEKIMALLRCIAVLICLLYGVLISVEAPKGRLDGRVQINAGIAMSAFILSLLYEMVVDGDPGKSRYVTPLHSS